MKKKEKFVDDGRTVADMNVDGMPGYRRAKTADQPTYSKQERKAIIKAMYKKFFTLLGVILFGFAIAIVIVSLWLH